MPEMKNIEISDKDKEILNKTSNSYNPAIITAGTVDGTKKQANSWTSSFVKAQSNTDVLPLTEEGLRKVKKHDVVDLGHRDKEIHETLEVQLSDGNNKRADEDLEETSEMQLDGVRANEASEVITEGGFEEIGAWNEDVWQGDDIKIYRDVNDREKQKAKMNEQFYKDNPELTDGGKGVVSASLKISQIINPDMTQQEIDQIAKIYDDAIRATQSIGGSVVTNKSIQDLEKAKENFLNEANQFLSSIKSQQQNISNNWNEV